MRPSANEMEFTLHVFPGVLARHAEALRGELSFPTSRLVEESKAQSLRIPADLARGELAHDGCLRGDINRLEFRRLIKSDEAIRAALWGEELVRFENPGRFFRLTQGGGRESNFLAVSLAVISCASGCQRERNAGLLPPLDGGANR